MSTTIGRMTTGSLASLLAALLVVAPAAAGVDEWLGQTQQEARQAAAQESDGLAHLRVATGRYLDIAHASADGFTPFASDEGYVRTCNGDTGGSRGARLVGALDSRLDPAEPEALDYEVTPEGRARLVAVEYIVPAFFVDDGHGNVVTPEVLGQPLRKHTTLPIYSLRAWVWEENPLGMFVEVNPKLGDCLPA